MHARHSTRYVKMPQLTARLMVRARVLELLASFFVPAVEILLEIGSQYQIACAVVAQAVCQSLALERSLGESRLKISCRKGAFPCAIS